MLKICKQAQKQADQPGDSCNRLGERQGGSAPGQRQRWEDIFQERTGRIHWQVGGRPEGQEGMKGDSCALSFSSWVCGVP